MGKIIYKREKLDWLIWDNSPITLEQAKQLFTSTWYKEKGCVYAWTKNDYLRNNLIIL